MASLKGIIICILISLTASPAVMYVTTRSVLLDPWTLMVIGFSLLAGISIVVAAFLPPSGLKPPPNMEGRGLLFYISALFMWASIADLTIQSSHFGFFLGMENNINYFLNGEPYLEEPGGIAAQYWNAIFNYILYCIIIYQIENGQDPRNVTLYWCGSIMTSQFVVMVAALSGSHSHHLQWSVWMNIIFVLFPVFIFGRTLTRPRSDMHRRRSVSFHSTGILKLVIICGLLLSTAICLVRGLGALNSQFPPIKHYVKNYEPYILEPIKFGTAWAMYCGMYLVPFQLIAVYALLTKGQQWMLDMSVFYAAAMFQGTFVFTVYSWFPSSTEEYRIPSKSLFTVVTLNICLVLNAHLLMYKCLMKPGQFYKPEKVNKEH